MDRSANDRHVHIAKQTNNEIYTHTHTHAAKTTHTGRNEGRLKHTYAR